MVNKSKQSRNPITEGTLADGMNLDVADVAVILKLKDVP
ncbi:hypothetical protein SAMN05443247_01730 [Bradyrhizobium erythrophlei]|nr:hypothetical protein SAMN05443247_01730 [Bradyrhizobium erythrophlei]